MAHACATGGPQLGRRLRSGRRWLQHRGRSSWRWKDAVVTQLTVTVGGSQGGGPPPFNGKVEGCCVPPSGNGPRKWTS